MTSFPFAKMYGEHKIVEKEGKIELTATIKVDGALSFLWERLVAKNVADKLEEDMDAMIMGAIDEEAKIVQNASQKSKEIKHSVHTAAEVNAPSLL